MERDEIEPRWKECWAASPEIHIVLRESESLEGARAKVIRHLEALDWSYRQDLESIPSWDYILLKEAVRCFKNIISIRNERLAGTSALEYLWTAARTGDSEVADAFIEEFVHLFKAIKGNSNIYPATFMEGTEFPDFEKYHGREAARVRSDYLDVMGKNMDRYIKRYPTGLEPKYVARRNGNRKRILDVLGGTEDDWYDWKWQFKHVMKDMKGLEVIKQVIVLDPKQEEGIELAIENDVPFGVTPHYLHLMDQEPNDHDFAIRRQVFPPKSYVENMVEHKADKDLAFDFMREHDTSPIDLITRRYPRVAIIKPYDSCPQICVYCQRNWEITSPLADDALASKTKIFKAIDWYAQHEELMDVLITGGDPLVMNDKFIDSILSKLAENENLRFIRLATRIPITVPMRVTEELCEIFGRYYEEGRRVICMVTHFTHPYEICLDTAKAIKKVRKQGMNVYNQTVFSFANSRRFENVALRIGMKQIGVDPYYLFNMKGKSEIEDYAVPVARLVQERKEEARLLPGLIRTDEPVFNVPLLGKNHLRAWQDHELIAVTPEGHRIYSFHPWEKNIAKVNPYLYTDVTLLDYLKKLEGRGEDPEDYSSIWYYY